MSEIIRDSLLPFSKPHIGDDEVNEVVKALRSGWLTTGPRVEQFEQDLKQFMGGEVEVLAVNSGTAALHLAVLSSGIGPGDVVLTTPMTWPATANMIMLSGAEVRFVDIDPQTLNMRADLIESALCDKVRGIMPVHLGGLCCDMTALNSLAAKHDLVILEDAAHALGSRCAEGLAGDCGKAGCFSFHPTKPITTGEGGALITRDVELAEKARLLRFHGVTRGAAARLSGTAEYEVTELGFKYNMLDMQAAIGLHQLQKAEEFRIRRESLTKLYNELLADLNGDLLHLPAMSPAGEVHAWHIYVVKVELDRLNCDRTVIREQLKAKNIATGLHYLTLHEQPLYQRTCGCKPEDFPASSWASRRVMSLPLFSDMTEDDVQYVAQAMREVLTNNVR